MYCNRKYNESKQSLYFSIRKNGSKCSNPNQLGKQKDGKSLTQRKTAAQQSVCDHALACARPPLAAPQCQGFLCRWRGACHHSCGSIPRAGGCCSTPADGGISACNSEFLLLSRETIGGADLCHTWGEDWGGGRETPGSDPLDP